MYKKISLRIASVVLSALAVSSFSFFLLPGAAHARETAVAVQAQSEFTVQAAALKASESSFSLEKGKTKTITLTYDGKTLAGSAASWATSKSSVATVKDGVVTAVGKGTATITAKYNGKSVSVKVTVIEKPGLAASVTSVTLQEGKSKTISLTYDDSSVSGSKAKWSTSNSKVATVKNGKITAKGEGKATITATYKNQSVSIAVTVEDKSKLEATTTKYTLDVGDKKTVKLKYDGKTLKASKADWKTSDSSVATVKDGTITAKGAGKATITATYKGKSVKIEVTVEEGDELEVDDNDITVKVNKKATITVKYNGKTVPGKDVKWSSSNTSVAKVSSSGVVTGKKKGTATITAKYKGKQVKIKVTVKKV